MPFAAGTAIRLVSGPGDGVPEDQAAAFACCAIAPTRAGRLAELGRPSLSERRRSAMKMYLVSFLAAMFALSPLSGVAGEKQVVDVKELAGSWRGWVTGEQGQERATMIVSPDGSYKASTTRGSTSEGQFALRDGKLVYQSSRTTGTARLSEDQGRTTLTVIPENPNYRTGTAEYERLK
jgi:hypothetical protein